MEALVSANQSAFILGRNLHDNFVLVRQVARRINCRKESGVLLKLDISRAFDSLDWAFLFEASTRGENDVKPPHLRLGCHITTTF